jgi:hypothetical protein
MHGAQARHWEWASEAQQHVPLPDASITVVDGGPRYIPSLRLLVVPFSNLGAEKRLGWNEHTEHGLFLHELGHAYDYANMTPARRASFKTLAGTTCSWWARHCVTDRWVSGPGVTVDIPPGEMFAEMYAACALGLTERAYQDAGFNSYGWVPPPGTDEQLCALIGGQSLG